MISSGHRRRPVGLAKTLMRETSLRLGTSILGATANLLQPQLQGGMPEIPLSRNHGSGRSAYAQAFSSSKASCKACTASSIYFRSISTEILISDVAITLMFTFSFESALNIVAATPA